VRKQEIAAEIQRQMAALGVTSQPAMVSWLRKKGLKISQPTLSRLLSGDYDDAPPSLIALCKYSSISMNNFLAESNPAQSERLMGALRTAWDGTFEREMFLARVIKAAGKLSRTYWFKERSQRDPRRRSPTITP
jgi:hypothetical protein